VPVLFCNISWMKYYAGRTEKDPPLGGGGFPRTEGYCGEECNFIPCEDGFVYGHFETIKGEEDRQVRIERLGGQIGDEYIDGIDIVWTAPTKGNDPRTVVGWSRNARLYRHRQLFGDDPPSDQHHMDEIMSFRVRARSEDVFLLPVKDRSMDLGRGAGWSGQASWWYAERTDDPDAAEFVRMVINTIEAGTLPAITTKLRNRKAGKNTRSGAAAKEPYQRYVKKYEVTIHPRHDKLQASFAAFLRKSYSKVGFPVCHRDDLRYQIEGETAVMVEVKPTDPTSLRYAIRAAIGQLLDYRQHQRWTDRQLIVVETEVSNADDLGLAHENGFGIAWPSKRGFTIKWPS